MGEVIEFRTKRLTGFIRDEDRPAHGEASKRAFWIGPEQTSDKPFADKAPSEFVAPSGDCA